MSDWSLQLEFGIPRPLALRRRANTFFESEDMQIESGVRWREILEQGVDALPRFLHVDFFGQIVLNFALAVALMSTASGRRSASPVRL